MALSELFPDKGVLGMEIRMKVNRGHGLAAACPSLSLTLEGALLTALFSTGGFAVPALQHISAASSAAQ